MAIDHEAHKIRIKAVSDRMNHPMEYNDAGAPKERRQSVLEAGIESLSGNRKIRLDHEAKVKKYNAEVNERKKAGISEVEWARAQDRQKEEQKKIDKWSDEYKKEKNKKKK